MNELRIYTKIHSQYWYLDASGQLPFNIIFGLCRRSASNTDPRPILLRIAGSVFDVPYALGHGLLALERLESHDGGREWVDVNVDILKDVQPKDGGYVSVPLVELSRGIPKTRNFTVYLASIPADDKFASLLEPGKRYRIRLVGRDLGVKWWMYTDAPWHEEENVPNETATLVNSKPTAGSAIFNVAKSIPLPPKVETRLRLPRPNIVEVLVTNPGPDAVTVQMRGQQRYLLAWGPFEPEEDGHNLRTPRIINPEYGHINLEIVDASTGDVVGGGDKPFTGCLGLTSGHVDTRAKLADVVVLKPNIPLSRHVSIEPIVTGLEDGRYKVRLKPRGCRWWRGEIGDTAAGDGRVPEHRGRLHAPPLVLESQDEVEFCIQSGIPCLD